MLLTLVDALADKVLAAGRAILGDKRERDASIAVEQQQVLTAQHEEFSYQAVNRNYFDSFVDGVNRLVRPFYTFGTIALLWYAVADPASFAVAMDALARVPEFLQMLFGAITVFWFGSRVFEKGVKFERVAQPAARNIQARPAQQESAVPDDAAPGSTGNPSIDEWIRRGRPNMSNRGQPRGTN